MSIIIAMSLFSLTMSISPGPVNFITFSTGMNHGFKNALPFVSGATFGFTLLLAVIGAGIGTLLMNHPLLLKLLGYGGTAYICYLGYKIATADIEAADTAAPAARFIDGALLQWLNPKAWTACIAGVTAFQLTEDNGWLWPFVAIYFVVCYLAIAAWAFAGSHTKAFIGSPRNLKRLNILLGGGLILLALYLLFLQASSSFE